MNLINEFPCMKSLMELGAPLCPTTKHFLLDSRAYAEFAACATQYTVMLEGSSLLLASGITMDGAAFIACVANSGEAIVRGGTEMFC